MLSTGLLCMGLLPKRQQDWQILRLGTQVSRRAWRQEAAAGMNEFLFVAKVAPCLQPLVKSTELP